MSSSRTETYLVDVTMPQMGVSVAEGTVVAWRVEIGDRIAGRRDDLRDLDRQDRHRGAVARQRRRGRDLVPVEATVAGRRGAGADRGGRGSGVHRPGAPATVSASARGERRRRRGWAGANGADAGATITARGRSVPRAGAGTPRSSSGSPPSIASTSARFRAPDAADGSASRTCSRSWSPERVEEAPLHIESPYRPEPAATPAAAASPRPLSRMRRQIGEHMKRSLETAATCTTWIEVDMARVEPARARARRDRPRVRRPSVRSTRCASIPALNAWLEGERYTRTAASTSESRCRWETTA